MCFLLRRQRQRQTLMTEVKFFSLDELLDGGLYTGDVTEIVGAAGTGKSQVHKL